MKVRYIVFLSIVLLAGIVFLNDLRAHKRIEAIKTVPTEQVRVTQGDTLWGLAKKYPIDSLSVEQTVFWLVEHNDLTDSQLVPGQQLTVARIQSDFVY